MTPAEGSLGNSGDVVSSDLRGVPHYTPLSTEPPNPFVVRHETTHRGRALFRSRNVFLVYPTTYPSTFCLSGNPHRTWGSCGGEGVRGGSGFVTVSGEARSYERMLPLFDVILLRQPRLTPLGTRISQQTDDASGPYKKKSFPEKVN